MNIARIQWVLLAGDAGIYALTWFNSIYFYLVIFPGQAGLGLLLALAD